VEVPVLVIAILVLVLIAVSLLIVLLFRQPRLDLDPLIQTQERVERSLRDEIARLRGEIASGLRGTSNAVVQQMATITQGNDQRFDNLRITVEQRLEAIRTDNAQQLERMRTTVDEKLQGTLEQRLGESFRLVSERLEQVSKGLGEMQSLASGVGDLKRVLTNVKTRGTWGEVQLGALLDQALAPDQFASNVALKDGREIVEYAVKLPGEGEPVWLPIDAKFPLDDYQRLQDAQERADLVAADLAGRQLEARIRVCARDIASKYVNPPVTTDFAILFLPTEGLFAEVLRRPGLSELIQREQRVILAGPTTLWSILSSLQMGFRTLAIQKRSSEVWSLLAAVKTEWSSYGAVLEKIQKKLQEAANTVDSAQTRSRAIGRKLKDVQMLPVAEAQEALGMASEAEYR
jgi:DNA recombination protein RmuC